MPTLAIPGAEGFAAYTVGGRFGTASARKSYIVTTTDDNDDAPLHQGGNTYTSSFRAACHASGPRFIVFATGGTCNLTLKDRAGLAHGNIDVRNPYLTILGGTAPGGGFCVNGIFVVFEDEFICTHMRFRGDNAWTAGNGKNPFAAIGCKQIYLDHCSVSWGADNAPAFADGTDLTYANCLIGPPLSISGQGRGPLLYGDRFSFIRNLIYNCVDRQPQIQRANTGCEVLYNSIIDKVQVVRTRFFPANTYGPIQANCQGNSHYWFAGTDLTHPTPDPPSSSYDSVKPISLIQGTTHSAASSLYLEDNYDEYWRKLGPEDEDLNLYVSGTLTSTILGTALDFSSSNYVLPTSTTAANAHAANIHATTGVGAWRVRDANAAFAVSRDTADTILINNSTASPTESLFDPLGAPTVDAVEDHVDPYPVLSTGLPLGSNFDGGKGTGSTRGGLPDSYTLPAGKFWYDERSGSTDPLEDGYTFLEGYAHGMETYWTGAPPTEFNAPVITTDTYTVTAGTLTTLDTPTQHTVSDVDSDIANVTYTSQGNTAVLKIATTTGVTISKP